MRGDAAFRPEPFREGDRTGNLVHGKVVENPHRTHAGCGMVRIRLPEYTDDCRDDAGGSGKADAVCDWPDDVPCDFGSPTLEERHPDVHHVVTRFTLTNEQQSAMVHEVDVNGREVEEVVREWMAANGDLRRAWLPGQGPGRVPPLVSGWLPDARRRRYANVKEYRRCSTTS